MVSCFEATHSLSLFPPLSPFSDLPPSQGGRYTGFGNTVQKPQKQESSAWDSLSAGWSSFTSSASTWATSAKEKASQLGSTINESVIKPSSQQVGEGEGGGGERERGREGGEREQ